MSEDELLYWMARSHEKPMKEEAAWSRSRLLRQLIFSTVSWKNTRQALKTLLPDIK